MRSPIAAGVISTLAVIFVTVAPVRATEDTFVAARGLYAAAEYDQALAMLSGLRPSTTDEMRSIQQYRAFCLLALGRTADAEQSIESIIAAEPSYHLSNA